MAMNVHIVEMIVERSAEAVYTFASRPDAMPRWASGLADGFEPAGDHWIATGPLGVAKVFFAPANPYGVMDHTVVLETGETTYNAFRVTANGTDAVMTFTVLQQPGTDAARFQADVDWVRRDLVRLKALLEAGDDEPA